MSISNVRANATRLESGTDIFGQRARAGTRRMVEKGGEDGRLRPSAEQPAFG